MTIKQLRRAYLAGRFDIVYRYIQQHRIYGNRLLQLVSRWG
jgi:hypothetical protein